MTIADGSVIWPGTLAPRNVALVMRGVAALGPTALTGDAVALQNDAGYWGLVLRDVPVGGAVNVAAWRAMLAVLEGGARALYVPVWDHEQAPWPLSGGREGNAKAPDMYDDGLGHDDGLGMTELAIRVTLNGAHALRATAIDVTVTTAGTIRAGMVFSLLGERVHTIREPTSATHWEIWPPLRRDYASGTDLDFDRPVLKATLISPRQGELALTRGVYGYTDVELREARPSND